MSCTARRRELAVYSVVRNVFVRCRREEESAGKRGFKSFAFSLDQLRVPLGRADF